MTAVETLPKMPLRSHAHARGASLPRIAQRDAKTPLKRIEMVDPEDLTSMFDVRGDIYDGGDKCRIKYVGNRRDGMEYVVKIQKKNRIRGGNEPLFRSTTERMLNMPDCANVVKVYACYEDSHFYYTLLEPLNGGDLFDFSRGGKWAKDLGAPVMEQVVRGLMVEVLSALAFLHSHGLVHKDVKLENLVHKVRGCVVPRSERSPRAQQKCQQTARNPAELKLIDFDFMEAAGTRSKSVMGTDGYIAPEAYQGDWGSKVDVFAAGVVMYVLVAGRYPYPDALFDDDPSENYVGSPKLQEIYAKLSKYKVYFGSVWDQVPEAKRFCKALLRFDPAKRPSAQEALGDPWVVAGQRSMSHLSGVVDAADAISDSSWSV
jgi:serine/threonine protein kinase